MLCDFELYYEYPPMVFGSVSFFVIDRLGPLWPVIGIIVEALVLFLIIFIAEKRKKDKEKGLWNSIYYE